MNWVGGARNRLKFQGDRRLQKEFFERKKLDLKVEKLQRATSCHSKKKRVSQDLLALHTVSNASIKAGNRTAKVQHVDLNTRHPANLTRRSQGFRLPRVPANVELPFSPELLPPSKLQLNESSSPSGENEGKYITFPPKHRNKESMASCHEMDTTFGKVPDSNKKPAMTHNNKGRIFQTFTRTQSPHSPHHLPTSQTSRPHRHMPSNVSKNPYRTMQGFETPLVLRTNTLQTETRARNPWVEEEFPLFDMKKIHEKFRSPLCVSQERDAIEDSKVSRSMDKERWIPYKHPFGQRHSKDASSSQSDQMLKENRTIESVSHYSETPILNKQKENYGNPLRQSGFVNTWIRTDACTGAKYRMVVSPERISAQSTPEFSTRTPAQRNPVESPIVSNAKTCRNVPFGPKVTSDATITVSSSGDHATTSSKLKNAPVSLARSSNSQGELKNPLTKSALSPILEDNEYQLKVRQLWLPEDFQPSLWSSNRKATKETPLISLYAYTPKHQKPPTSKWEPFLESPPKKPSSPSLARFSVPHTPSPNLWKTALQKKQTISAWSVSDSRAADGSRVSSLAREMWNNSDSESSSTFTLKSRSEGVKYSYTMSHDSKLSPRPLCFSPSFHSHISRENRSVKTSDSANQEFDWRHDLLAQRPLKSLDIRGKRNGGANDTAPTSGCAGLATPISNNLHQHPLQPPKPILWPKKESRRKVLQELDQLDSEDTRSGTKRRALPEPQGRSNSHETLSKVKKIRQDPPGSRGNHDSQIREDAVCNSYDSVLVCDQFTDASDTTESLESQNDTSTTAITSDGKETKVQSQDSSDTESDPNAVVSHSSVLERLECSDTEFDPDRSIQDAVEAMVHQVVMKENRNNQTHVPTTQSTKPKKLRSASEMDFPQAAQPSAGVFCCIPQRGEAKDSNHQDNRHSSLSESRCVSVHIQTDWSLLHVDIPANWVTGTPVTVKNEVERGTQWEPPSSQLCTEVIQTETTQPPSDQHGKAATPLSSEQHVLPLQEQKVMEPALAPPQDTGAPNTPAMCTETIDTCNKQTEKAMFLSPMHSPTSQLPSFHVSVADNQRATAIGSFENLPKTSTLNNLCTPNMEIPKMSSVNDSNDKPKTPDTCTKNICAEVMGAPEKSTMSLSTENRETPKIPPMNVSWGNLEVPQLLSCEERIVTESTNSLPECRESNNVDPNTESLCQETENVLQTIMANSSSRSEIVGESDRDIQADIPTHDTLPHCQAGQAVGDSSSPPLKQNASLPNFVGMDTENHILQTRAKEVTQPESLTPHDGSVPSTTQSQKRATEHVLSPSLHKETLQNDSSVYSSSNTDQAVKNIVSATATSLITEHQTTALQSSGGSTKALKQKPVYKTTASAYTETNMTRSRMYSPSASELDNSSEVLSVPARTYSDQDISDHTPAEKATVVFSASEP